MDKKGFTLIELISVVALLSIIAVLMIPKISEAFKTSRADQLEEIRESVATAAEVYLNSKCGRDYYNLLIENDTVKIYLSSISECGLIDKIIYNPVSGENFDTDSEFVNVYIDEVGLIDYKFSF